MKPSQGKIEAISISDQKGVGKTNVPEAMLKKEWGIEGDAHAGDGHRQVSLLAMESVRRMQEMGAEVHPGIFGENITSTGLDLLKIRVGDRLRINSCLLEITQIGKECLKPCSIFYQVGECIMPKEGCFTRVLHGGKIRVGDPIVMECD
ncbi:MAG: MOSC domain-containing protein [Planctomycetota bacterium]